VADQRGEERLDGWKAIARHLGRDERTVRRWEARGLPVRRVPGGPRAPVYANTADLDRWLNANAALAAADADIDDDPAPALTDAPPASDKASSPVAPAPDPGHRFPTGSARRWRASILAATTLAAVAAFAFAWSARTPASPAATPPKLDANPAAIDPLAREDYLNGYHAWSLRTPAGLAQARQDFGAAIAREPGYAPAYAGLANTYLLLREFGSMTDAEAYPKATAAAETALRLDPNLAAAHRARAFALFWSKHDAPAAWAEFDRALELAPNDALTFHWYATALSMGSRKADALRMIARARALDPGSTAILTDEALILYDAGWHAQARAQLARVVALDPANADAHRYLVDIARTEGRIADFQRETGEADRLRDLPPTGMPTRVALYH